MRPTRACYFPIITILLGYLAGAYAEERDTLLTHNWEPCQADHAARPLLYQHYQSLALQHQKTANKTVDNEPRYKINIEE